MPPHRKYKRPAPDPSTSGPPRKSPRKLGKRPPPPPQTSLSVMSSESESLHSWPILAEQARQRITRYQPQNRRLDEKVQTSLNAFIDGLPEGGRESIARDCIDATTDDELHQVFENLLTGLAIPMKARTKLPTVTGSPHPNRQSNVEAIAGTLTQPGTREQAFRDRCLLRDSYKCVITGEMDTGHWENLGSPEGIDFAPAEAAHIIPFSYASWETTNPSYDRAKAWEVLYRCFPEVRRISFTVDNINDLSNGLTLRNSVHDNFGKFNISLKPSDVQNEYEVKSYRRYPPSDRRLLPKSIKFEQTENAQQFALPSRTLLDCHYRLAEILNASGLGETIERHMRKWEDLKERTHNLVVREDGGTDIGEFLHVGLWQYAMA